MAFRDRRAAGARRRSRRSARSSRTTPTIRACRSRCCATASRTRAQRPSTVSIAYSIENPIVDARSGQRGRARHARQRARAATTRVQRPADAQPLSRDGRPAGGHARPLGARRRAEAASRCCADGRARAGGPARCTSGTTSRPTARSAPRPPSRGPVGAVCLQRTLAPGASRRLHVPSDAGISRTARRNAAAGARRGRRAASSSATHYCTRFADAWAAAAYAAEHLPRLEARTRLFAGRHSREHASRPRSRTPPCANLSTLVTPTCFRTADGEFHGFEGCNDTSGCCYGNCTHVWNYETATAHLSRRCPARCAAPRSATRWTMRAACASGSCCPTARSASGYAAADGQMGQIIKVYLDWRLSGDDGLLRELWPKVKKALAFAWIDGRLGCRSRRRARRRAAQHLRHRVLRPQSACAASTISARCARSEEMARAVGDTADARRGAAALRVAGATGSTRTCSTASTTSSRCRAGRARRSASRCCSTMGSDDTEQPEYQMGDGCLVDQLVGQYQAEVAGLGPLVDPAHCRTALTASIATTTSATLFEHASVQRTFALNDEAALVVCDYGRRRTPGGAVSRTTPRRGPASNTPPARHMIYAGMVARGRRVHHQHPRAVRRRAAQSVERARMRLALRARDGVVVGAAGDQRLPLSRRPARGHRAAAARGWRIPLLLVHRHGLGRPSPIDASRHSAQIRVLHGTLPCASGAPLRVARGSCARRAVRRTRQERAGHRHRRLSAAPTSRRLAEGHELVVCELDGHSSMVVSPAARRAANEVRPSRPSLALVGGISRAPAKTVARRWRRRGA